MTSDPCKDSWFGVYCDEQALSVKKIDLGGLGFTGTFDASTICNVQSIATSLTILGLSNNGLGGGNLDQIASCRQLTHLNLGGNSSSVIYSFKFTSKCSKDNADSSPPDEHANSTAK
ncbi:hypothetical protein CsSME_00047939 [Camellia sinensis var. sinensis]